MAIPAASRAEAVTERPPTLPASLAETLAGYDWSPDHRGGSGGSVWHLERAGAPTVYLKHGAGALARDIADEAHRLAWVRGRAAAPEIVHFTQVDGTAWLLTTALPGCTAYAALEHAPEQADTLVGAMAGYLRTLHAIDPASCPFNSAHGLRMALAERRMAEGLVDTEDFDDAHLGWPLARLWEKLTALVPQSPQHVITHGDFSLDNILVEDGRVTGCIDWGRMGVADPYQDLAILWSGLAEFGTDAQAALWRAYGIASPDRSRLDFHLTLDELF